MALNNQIISSISGNLVANGDGNITGANIANITSNLQTFISNNGTDIKSVSIQSSTDANFTANYTLTLPVDEGTAGQILATDGSGVLSWETISPSSIANGNSNVNIPDANGNVNISAVGNANILVVTGTGANIYGTANITGNANIANLGLGIAEITLANIDTVNTELVQNGNSNVTITANANITLTAKSNVVMVISDTGANITGTANVTGDILASANVNVTSNINGARFQNGNSNIVITSNANITLTAKSNSTMVISDTGANITGTGNISGNLSAGNISTAALTATGNIDFTGDNVSLGAVGNLHITGGSSGLVLTTDGSGNLSWGTGGVAAAIANGTSNVSIPSSGGNVDISVAGNANILVVTGTGANITGTANVTGDVLAGANINVTSNINGAKFQNGNSNIAITANANITLTAKSNATMVISDTSANVTGNLDVSGFINAAVIKNNNSNITLFDGGNLQMTSNGNIIMNVSDSGNGIYINGIGNFTGNVNAANFVGVLANGNSSVAITSNANVTITSKSNATMIVTDTGANITGTLNATGNANVGNLGTTTAIITTGNISTINSGLLQNGNSNIAISASSNVTISAIGNADVVTVTGSNVVLANAVALTFIGNNGTALRQVNVKASTNANFSANYSLTLPANTGTSGQLLSTDGTGLLSWTSVGSSSLVNGNSNIVITANANITMSSGGISPVFTITPLTSHFNGDVYFANSIYANVSGGIVGNLTNGSDSNIAIAPAGNGQISLVANSNLMITITGTAVTINGNGNINGGNIISSVRMIATGTGETGNGGGQLYLNGSTLNRIDWNTNGTGAPALTTRSAGTKLTLYPAISGSEVDYGIGVESGALWHSVPGAGQSFKWYGATTEAANLTGGGTFTAIVLKTAVDGSLIAVANNGTSNRQVSIKASTDAGFTGNYTLTLPVDDGTSGQVLQTNGSGVLSWANPGGSSASISNGTSNVNIASSGGNVDISVGGTSNVLVVTGTGANITGTLNATGNANVGNLGTTTAIITTGNITTINTGLVQNGNSNIVITSNANVTITSKSNAVMVITDTGANITGTGNFSGETSAIKFLSTFSIGDEGGEIFLAKPQSNTTIAGTGVVVDIYQNKLRFFEEGGSTRGYYLDITAGSSGAGTNIIGGGGGGSNIVNGSSNVDIPTSGGNVNTSVAGNANVFVVTGTGANLAGIANVTGNIIGGEKLLVGTGTSSLADPAAVFQGSSSLFVQVALFNSQGTGSADLVAYGNNGDDTQSWTDMGFTGNTFSDANYTVTGAGDGYLFVQGNASFGGNLVIATGNTGTTKDIIFATGGFQTGNIKARLYNANGLLSVTGNISSGNANLGNLVTANYFSGQANLLTVDGGNAVGFRNVPINEQSAAYTTVLSDSGKAIFHPDGDAIRTYTIDSNANVAYPLGTVLTFINMSANAVTIDINADTLYLAGNGATGSRTLAQYGMASAIKMTTSSSNTWIISGSGLT